MSTAVVERITEEQAGLDLVVNNALHGYEERVYEETEQWDPHPLIPVFLAMAISLLLSVTFIGSIVAWLALRHSGVMAP
jgi:hypothetical protein